MKQFSVIELLVDNKTMPFNVFKKKHGSKIPKDLTINYTLNQVLKATPELLLDRTVEEEDQAPKLIENNGKYEVFLARAGVKECLEIYNNIEEAVFSKLDLLFNELGHVPRDSRINSYLL